VGFSFSVVVELLVVLTVLDVLDVLDVLEGEEVLNVDFCVRD
jgi:hypothetical protein